MSRRFSTAAVLACAALLVGKAQAQSQGMVPETSRPPILRNVGIDQRLNESVPLDLPFRDEAGKSVHLGDYFGQRPIVLALAYYECPMLCTLVLNGVASAVKGLGLKPGIDFDVVVVSFDARETPALAAAKKANLLKEYGQLDAAAGWHFLTGDQGPIDQLTHATGFRYVYDEVSKQFAHSAAIMVLTPAGVLARYYYGVEYAPRDVRLGLVEAANGKIGTPVDQFLLFCFHYDPATGTYGTIAMNSVRLGGVLTVVTLVGFIVTMLRRERRQARPAVAGAERVR